MTKENGSIKLFVSFLEEEMLNIQTFIEKGYGKTRFKNTGV